MEKYEKHPTSRTELMILQITHELGIFLLVRFVTSEIPPPALPFYYFSQFHKILAQSYHHVAV